MVQLKLWADDHTDGPLRTLEVYEAVSLGLEGKRMLWRALAAVSESSTDLRGPDYGRLKQRAEEQRQAVEAERVAAAKAAARISGGKSEITRSGRLIDQLEQFTDGRQCLHAVQQLVK